MLKQKILSIWIGLCYLSLTILLGACDDSCCCTPMPTTNLGKIYIFLDLLSSSSECQSPLNAVGDVNNAFLAVTPEQPCSQSWSFNIKVGGTEGTCLWSSDRGMGNAVARNGRTAFEIKSIPLRDDIGITVTVLEPKHDPVSNTCTQCTGQYSLRYSGKLQTKLVNEQEVFISCIDLKQTICCN
jgi:hypothetical protein